MSATSHPAVNKRQALQGLATPTKNLVAGLEVRGLGICFGAIAAVDSVDLKIGHGERHAILGPNGAGKTTLFNLVTGDLRATSGQVILDGQDVTRLGPAQRVRAGLRRTYQKSLLFSSLSVQENLYLALRGVTGMPLSCWRSALDAAIDTQAAELAARVRLDRVLLQPVSELSYGQQRQLEVALALTGTPKLILFDEPAAGLSPTERTELVTLIEGLPRDLSIGLVEHDLDIAMRLSDRVTIMQDGRVVASGTPDEIANDPMVKRIYMGAHHG
jgi:branched-chain amino acid transport system ATP-binding protein